MKVVWLLLITDKIIMKIFRNFHIFYVFYYFIKNAFFNVYYFWNVFLFPSGEISYPIKPAKILLNLLHFSIKQLLNDGFNMAVIKILSWRAVALKRYQHIKTAILLGNLFHLVYVILLIYQQRFLLNVFLSSFFIKTRLLRFS